MCRIQQPTTNKQIKLSPLLKLLRLYAMTTSRGSLFQGFETLEAKLSLPTSLPTLPLTYHLH